MKHKDCGGYFIIEQKRCSHGFRSNECYMRCDKCGFILESPKKAKRKRPKK